MGAVAAATARAMAQKIQRVIPGINYTFINQTPLLKIAQMKNNIIWKGSHTEFEWHVYKDDVDEADWGGGELSVNTFEEQDPATQAKLPYCWLQKNYGVSDRTMEANRHSPDRVYKPLGANLNLAKIKIFNGIRNTIYDGGDDGNGSGAGSPVGLKWAIGDAKEDTSKVYILAAASYAGKALVGGTNITAYVAGKTSFAETQWAPEVLSIHEVPNIVTDTKWSTNCIIALAYMEEEMEVTADMSGTGKSQKPDTALMARSPFHALVAKAVTNQSTYGIPAQLVNKDLRLAGWTNIMVGGLTCIKDNNVPVDGNATGLERVIVLDSKQFKIKTTHTKQEGLIKNDFDETAVIVNGVIGKLTVNLAYYILSPSAIGCILGCDD